VIECEVVKKLQLPNLNKTVHVENPCTDRRIIIKCLNKTFGTGHIPVVHPPGEHTSSSDSIQGGKKFLNYLIATY
jgi:hypothetical protein